MAVASTTIQQNAVLCESSIHAGYVSDDDDDENRPDYEQEPQESGRTRSSTRRAAAQSKDKTQQESPVSESPAKSSQNKGRGRKRKKGTSGDGSDSDDDNDDKKLKEPLPKVVEVVQQPEPVVCSCPKDVMTCIGILPSLPLIGKFTDSSDSDSSTLDDLTHTVLPSVNRNRRTTEHDG